jgi:hypothetical protein
MVSIAVVRGYGTTSKAPPQAPLKYPSSTPNPEGVILESMTKTTAKMREQRASEMEGEKRLRKKDKKFGWKHLLVYLRGNKSRT